MLQRTNTAHRHDCSSISKNNLDIKNHFTIDVSIFFFFTRMWWIDYYLTGKRCSHSLPILPVREHCHWGIKLLIWFVAIFSDILALYTNTEIHQTWMYYLLSEQNVQTNIYFLLTGEKKLYKHVGSLLNVLHCTVLYTCLWILQKCLLNMWYLFIDSTWCSSMSVE